ncbi:MAG: FAD-dependent oxidoreductase [Sulfolobaceae archaeon]
MVELIIIGSGITGLLVKEKIPDSVIYEKEKRIEKLNSMASLWTIIPPLCGQFINECINGIEYYKNLAKKYSVYFKEAQVINDKGLGKEKEISDIEPYLKINIAFVYENGLFVNGESLIKKMINEQVKLGIKVNKLVIEKDEVKEVVLSNGERKSVSYMVLTTGYLTKELIGSINYELIKGHLVKIPLGEFKLRNIIFLKGKIAVADDKCLFINGDALKDEKYNIDFEVVKDHLNFISSTFPINPDSISVRVGFRAVSKDGNPIVIKPYKNAVLITGYRFGFALAPVLVDQALKLLFSSDYK